MQLLLLPLLPALAVACNPSYLKDGVTFSLVVEKMLYYPVDWAVANTPNIWAFSEFSQSSTEAQRKFQQFAIEMLHDAFHHVLLDYLGPQYVPQNTDGVSFAVHPTYNPPVCDDLSSSTILFSTTRTTPAAGVANNNFYMPNVTCIVSGDNLIIGVCGYVQNCTATRNNLPFSTATGTFTMTFPDNTLVQSQWLTIAPKLLEREFIRRMQYHAKKYMKVRFNSAMEPASVLISKIGKGAVITPMDDNINGDDDF